MDLLPNPIAGRHALQRITPKNAVTFLGPINDRPFTLPVHRPAAGVAQPLSFRKIGFAATQPIFGLLPLIDLNREAIPLNDASLPIPQRLTSSMVPTKPAVRPAQTHNTLVRSSGLDCVPESLCGFL